PREGFAFHRRRRLSHTHSRQTGRRRPRDRRAKPKPPSPPVKRLAANPAGLAPPPHRLPAGPLIFDALPPHFRFAILNGFHERLPRRPIMPDQFVGGQMRSTERLLIICIGVPSSESAFTLKP